MRYLIIGDYGALKRVEQIGKNDLVMCLQRKYEWLIDLEENKAFSADKNAWLPLTDFPV